jgi:histidine ammonia-lyase
MEILIDGDHLTLEQLNAVARENAIVHLAPGVSEKMQTSRAVIDEILKSGRVVYGVNTGFGKLSEVRIPREQVNELQLNLIRSHSAGVGDPYSEEATRAIMLLRVNVLAKGNSGIRAEVVELLLEMLNHKVHPVIPSKGSVGASGDLAPLSHLSLVLVGEGLARVHGRILPGDEALKQAELQPVVLQAKEGLALINGTQAMTGVGALAWQDASQLARVADIAGAMTVDAMRGTDVAFDERIVNVRPHPGALEVAGNLRHYLAGSEIRASHRDSTHKVQDHYSLRCMPQVHGAVRDALRTAEQWLTIEINAATDNPLVFPESETLLSGGNFHGAPMSLCFDFLAIALCQLANISERRTALLIDPSQSELPAFLTRQSGLHSGFMMAQVTAAALASENKILAHPASADTIPTSANKEDHVSMGVTAALKLQQIVENTCRILAIELLCAAQAIDLLAPLATSPALAKFHAAIRREIPFMDHDRILYPDIEKACALLARF